MPTSHSMEFDSLAQVSRRLRCLPVPFGRRREIWRVRNLVITTVVPSGLWPDGCSRRQGTASASRPCLRPPAAQDQLHPAVREACAAEQRSRHSCQLPGTPREVSFESLRSHEGVVNETFSSGADSASLALSLRHDGNLTGQCASVVRASDRPRMRRVSCGRELPPAHVLGALVQAHRLLCRKILWTRPKVSTTCRLASWSKPA